MPSNIDAQPTTRAPGAWSGCRLATPSPTISCIGKPGARVAPQPSSAAGCGQTPPRTAGEVAAADGAGAAGQQHVPGREAGGLRGRDLDLLEAEGTAERLCPHVGLH